LLYVPEDLKIAAGADFVALGDNSTPYAGQLLEQFKPLLALLARAGISQRQIDQLWTGSNREKGDMVACVRTRSNFDAAAVTKGLGALGKTEKIGHASVHVLPASADIVNSVAYIDGKTFLIGRSSTVIAALSNPKPGAIRFGLEAMAQPKAYYWIAGDDGSAQWLNIKGFEGTEWLVADAPKPRGMAKCLAKADDGAQGGFAGGGAMPGSAPQAMAPGGGSPAGGHGSPAGHGAPAAGNGGAAPAAGQGAGSPAGHGAPAGGNGGAAPAAGQGAGSPAGHGAPAAGHAPKSFNEYLQPGPGVGHASPAGAGHASPAGMMPGAFGGMNPGGSGQSGGSSKPVEITVGWSFNSESAAAQVETTLQEVIKSIAAAQRQAMSGAPPGAGGMMGPGGGPAGPQPGGGANPAAGHNAPGFRAFLQGNPAGGAPAGGHGAAGSSPAGGHGGMPAGGMMPAGMAGSSPGADNDPNSVTVFVTREKANVRLRYNVRADDNVAVGKLVAKAVQASGASALNDGLFDGTLPLLNNAFRLWETEKPDRLIGTKKIRNLPIRAGYSWMTELLPYVGHGDLYNGINFEKSWTDAINIQTAFTVIPAFLNPADSRSTWDGYPFPGMALSHFAGMSGVEDRRNVVAAELPRSDPRAGIFGYDRIARNEEITDGTSQTIMIVGTGAVVAPWIQGGGATIRGVRQNAFDVQSGVGSKGLSKPGTYVLFADGSARIISADIDPAVFKSLCTMHGAEEIDMNKIAQGN
jgi:hypothetical protein